MTNSSNKSARVGWVELHIMLALGQGDLHGYAIMQKVAEETNGRIQLGPGTLYGAIKRLTASGLIAVAPIGRHKEADKRRICYRLLPAGRQALRVELGHVAEIARIAKAIGMPIPN